MEPIKMSESNRQAVIALDNRAEAARVTLKLSVKACADNIEKIYDSEQTLMDRIYEEYGLDNDKEYLIDKDTGLIEEAPDIELKDEAEGSMEGSTDKPSAYDQDHTDKPI